MRHTCLYLTVIILSCLIAGTALAQSDYTPPSQTDRMTIEISRFEHFDASQPISISVNLIDGHKEISGFEFLLSYNSRVLGIESVTPGFAISESVCDWEYFTYRTDDSAIFDPATGNYVDHDGLLHVIALADVNNGDNYPNCYLPGSLPAELFKINFNLIVDREMVNCVIEPVRFYWSRCADNVFASYDGSDTFIADTVIEWAYEPYNIANPNDTNGYPTYLGPQDFDCFITGTPTSPTRALTLINGGIDFVCIEPPFDFTGDVNLNGIAYEIADWVLFSRFFTEGMAAFTIDGNAQARATDVTYDGIPLTINDLVYLGRVIHGQALPLPGPSNWEDHQHGNASVKIDSMTHTLLVRTAEIMGGAFFVLAGEVTPRLLKSNMQLDYAYDAPMHQTYVLISSLNGETFGEGPLLGDVSTDRIFQMEIANFESYIIDLNMGSSDPRYTIRLSVPDNDLYNGQTFTAYINMDPTPFEMGGFDLMVQFDPVVFSLRSVQPGSFITNCDWEYFTYREGNNGFCDSSVCPSGVVKIVALADLYSQPEMPSCFGESSDRTNQLAAIELSVSDDLLFNSATMPLRFLWYQCKDNTISSKSGEQLFISDRVFDMVQVDTIPGTIPIDITNRNDPGGYPTIHGSQNRDCQVDSSKSQARALINFYNEMVTIGAVEPQYIRGDINFNDIPFEIADWVLFSNYFIFGMEVFTVNKAGQAMASDVNMDGIVLGVDDFVYMMHVISSGHEPTGGDPDSVRIGLSESGTLAVQSDLRENISAIHLVAEGDLTPVLIAEQMQMAFNFDGVKTRIFIYSPEPGNTIGKEEILILPGAENILSIEAATVDARGMKIEFERDFQTGVTDPDGNLPGQFALRQNYPNPFNPSTAISFDLPRASEVLFEVLNIIGQTVYSRSAYYSAGSHTIEWNADQIGRQVASGIYYYRIEAGDFSESRKMILLK